MKSNWVRALIIAGFVLVFAGFFYFRLYHFLTFNALQHYRQKLLNWTQTHYLATVASFIGLYIVAVAASIPGAVFLTLAGGVLFGIVLGTVYVVIAATLGAIVLFLAVKTTLGPWFVKRASGWANKFELGFKKNAFNYLLTLRLIPVFPFWLVNIASALLDVPLSTFVLATALGIIPGSFVYVLLGNSLGYLFDRGQTPNLGIIFTPHILLPLIALGLLSLLPILYKHLKGKSV